MSNIYDIHVSNISGMRRYASSYPPTDLVMTIVYYKMLVEPSSVVGLIEALLRDIKTLETNLELMDERLKEKADERVDN